MLRKETSSLAEIWTVSDWQKIVSVMYYRTIGLELVNVTT